MTLLGTQKQTKKKSKEMQEIDYISSNLFVCRFPPSNKNEHTFFVHKIFLRF